MTNLINKTLDFLDVLGQIFMNFLGAVGRLSLFTGNAVIKTFHPPFYIKASFKQLIEIGYNSLPVVGLTAVFTGAVLVLQTYTGFSRFNAESSIATVVVISITRELGPVLAGLIVAGRIGAAIASELGTMRVTEQIDALSTLSTNPVRYLVTPRLIAATLALPMLVLVADIIGVFGGYIVAVHKLGFNPATYLQKTLDYLETKDVVSGLVKAGVFGFIIALMGCYHGFHSRGGAQGVGQAVTYAVVSASMLILLSNYILTGLFFGT